MTFNEAIYNIMKDVENGSNEPFIIYRDNNGEWHSDHTWNQYGEAFDWIEDVKEIDPLAFEFTGKDFNKGSYPYVYDAVLTSRIRAEFNQNLKSGMYSNNSSEAFYKGMSENEARALGNFFEDNITEFTHKVTDYLTTVERPLAAIKEMCPYNMESDNKDWYYNEDLARAAIEHIENSVDVRLGKKNINMVTAHNSMPGIRINAGEYTPVLTTNLASWQVTLAENMEKSHPYLVEKRREPDIGIPNDTYFCGVTTDYLEAITEFSNHLQTCVDVARSNREAMKSVHNVDYQAINAADCIQDSRNADYTGQLLVIKASELKPEFRTADSQLVLCTHGNGARYNAKGTSIFGKELFSGNSVCYGRHQIEGIANPKKLPKWVNDKMNEHKESQLKTKDKPTLQEKLTEAKSKAAREAVNNKEKCAKPKKRNNMEVK